MEFGPSDTQRLFDRILREFLADHLPMDTLHQLAASGAGFHDTLWTGLTQLGLAGVLVPERSGGAGLGTFEAGLAAEALAAHAAPLPFAGASVMAPLALLRAGSDSARAAWLPRIANGTARIAVAFPQLDATAAAPALDRRGDRLSGRTGSVIDLGGATHVLIALADGALALAAADGPGVSVTLHPTLDRTRARGEVTLAGAPAELVADGDAGRAAAAAMLAAGRAMLAADTLGAAQAMLDRAVVHARQREQFGRPIGSFQAVKHLCAEMATLLEPARALVWHAAHAQDALPGEAALLACHAKAHLAEVGREVARMATEVHGGMGFTHELGLHYWFKRISANRQLLGGPEWCRREAAALQGWGAA